MAVKIGDKFNSSYADSCPEWTVTQKRGRGTWIARVTSDDWTGTEQAFTTEDIEGAMHSAQVYAAMNCDHDRFYKSLKFGSIVHYSNGHGTYIRCEVVPCAVPVGFDSEAPPHGRGLCPIALVGAWGAHDLPSRYADGSPRLSYHVQKIMEKEPMIPNYSNIYESPDFVDRLGVDPRHLPPIDLSLPKLSPSEKEAADLVTLINEISQTACWEESGLSPKGRLRAVLDLVTSDRAKRHLA